MKDSKCESCTYKKTNELKEYNISDLMDAQMLDTDKKTNSLIVNDLK